MEYTKDIMFHIKYKQDKNVLRLNKQSKKSTFIQLLKRYKFMTVMLVIGISLIATDIVLVNNFIHLLKQF